MKKDIQHRSEISIVNQNIQYYQQMMASSICPYQKIFYRNQLDNQIRLLSYWQRYYQQTGNYDSHQGKRTPCARVEFTPEELAQYDGSGGRPAYVAVNGVVYDVSLEKTWGGGTHFSLYAGQDLTAQFAGCHDGRLEVLRNLPRVGVLKR